MRKNILFLLLLLVVGVVACGGNKATIQDKQSATTAAQTKQNDMTYIRMHRSACFGKCPDYIFELYKNGLVRYTGRNFVEPIGVYEKQYPAATVQKLFDEFNAKRVDTMQEVYENVISDLPGIYYTFEYTNKPTKKITNAHFGPYFLKDLATLVDSTISVDRSWTKISDGPAGD